MTNDNDSLNIFGKFLMEKLRDNAIDCFDKMAEGKLMSPSTKNLQKNLRALDVEQLNAARNSFIYALDSGIHDFLFAVQEENNFEKKIKILANNKNIVELSDGNGADGIHGELFLENGWFEKYSKYGEFDPDKKVDDSKKSFFQKILGK